MVIGRGDDADVLRSVFNVIYLTNINDLSEGAECVSLRLSPACALLVFKKICIFMVFVGGDADAAA